AFVVGSGAVPAWTVRVSSFCSVTEDTPSVSGRGLWRAWVSVLQALRQLAKLDGTPLGQVRLAVMFQHRLHGAAPSDEALRATVLVAVGEPGTLRGAQSLDVAGLAVVARLIPVEISHQRQRLPPLLVQRLVYALEFAGSARVHFHLRARLFAWTAVVRVGGFPRALREKEQQCGQQHAAFSSISARIGSSPVSGVSPSLANRAASLS